jgi:hypothetical protein
MLALKAQQRTVWEWALVALIGFVIVVWWAPRNLPRSFFREWLMPFTGIYFVLSSAFISSKIQQYRREAKQRVMVPLARKFFPELQYSPDRHIAREHYTAAQLFHQRIHQLTGNDHFRGRLGEVDFEFSELLCTYRTGGKKKRREVAFRGFFFVGEFHRKLSFRTQIVPEHFDNVSKDLGLGFQRLFSMSTEQLVQLENVAFEKLFRVTSGDQVEARLILTPRLMETLVDFRRLVGNSVYLSFQGDRMYLAVSTHHDYFEPRLWGEVVNRLDLLKFADMLVLMLAAADEILKPHPASLGPLPKLATQGLAPVRQPVARPELRRGGK